MVFRPAFSLRLGPILGALVALSACDDTDLPGFLSSGGAETKPAASTSRSGGKRDVEAPEIFQVTDKGLWDGRPSLGGIWVAHTDVRDPQRVLIRNQSNGKSVVGVLYRPERAAPGPKFQVSSDAAAALDMQAGQPAELNVTALKREEIPAPEPEEKPAEAKQANAPAAPKSTDPIKAAQRALDAADAKPALSAAAISSTAASATAQSAAAGDEKSYIQVGLFSVERNANDTAAALSKGGMTASVQKVKASGKSYWRVIIGPVATERERNALLKKIKRLGFKDAEAVTG